MLLHHLQTPAADKLENLQTRIDQARTDERQYRLVAADCQDEGDLHFAKQGVRRSLAAQVALKSMIARLR